MIDMLLSGFLSRLASVCENIHTWQRATVWLIVEKLTENTIEISCLIQLKRH